MRVPVAAAAGFNEAAAALPRMRAYIQVSALNCKYCSVASAPRIGRLPASPARSIDFTMSNSALNYKRLFALRALPLCHARLQRSRGGGSSAPRNNFYHDSRPLHRLKSLAQAFHARVHLVRWAKVQDEDVVVVSVDHVFNESEGGSRTREGNASFSQPT